MNNDHPGAPLSQVYLRPSAPMKDSQRFRNRLAAYVLNGSFVNPTELVEFLQPRMGAAELHTPNSPYLKVLNLIRCGELRDVLDVITYIAHHIGRGINPAKRLGPWQSFIARVFAEESLGYVLDERCGVRYQVDREFEGIGLASIAHLGIPRYRAVLHEFEAAYGAIEGNPPNTKLAVRSMFEAIETLFRLMVGPKAKLLGSPEVKQFLPPMIRSLYTDALAANMMVQLVNGLADWVNGLQAYRHGPGVEEPSPPPMEAAVAALQTGSAYLRLLVELDRKVQSGSEDA